jgi:carboxypeptidase Taq
MIAADPVFELIEELKRLHALGSAAGLLGWDEQVNLPPASADNRARQLAEMADLVHRESIRPEVGELLEKAEQAAAGEATEDLRRQTTVREARKDYDRDARLPGEFIKRKAAAESRSYHAWVRARADKDFSSFMPHLVEQLELAQEAAAYLGFTSPEEAYDYQIDLHDPGMTAGKIEVMFSDLRADLVPLVQEIIDSPVRARTELLKGFPIDRQETFLREVVAGLGFDFERGRIDRAVHPFCSGDAFDTRLTTRFFEDTPLDSLFSSIHETGHGLYEQGLPADWIGTGAGTAVGMAVHESQSRLWENQVGRSRGFWQYWEPRYRELFLNQLAKVSPDELYLAVNAVSLNPIRVDSDEVTYNLHIILRFELEKRLFRGELAVKDLPEAWVSLSEELMGYTPKDDAEGVLQDVHWSGGMFGYFPSYCLGNMLAAQLWYTANEVLPELEEQFAEGNFETLLLWLRKEIHAHGRCYDTLELTRRVTGRDLSPRALLRYLRERYLPLYREA